MFKKCNIIQIITIIAINVFPQPGDCSRNLVSNIIRSRIPVMNRDARVINKLHETESQTNYKYYCMSFWPFSISCF